MLRSTDGMFYSKVTLFLCHSNQHPREAAQAPLLSISQTLWPSRASTWKIRAQQYNFSMLPHRNTARLRETILAPEKGF